MRMDRRAAILAANQLPPIGTPFADCTWQQIRAVSDAGLASTFFRVGDTKTVTVSGTVGEVTLENYAMPLVILGFDHNAQLEGDRRIHLQLWAEGTQSRGVCFVDSKYGVNGGLGCFSMTEGTSNAGGWESCQMRTQICAEFYALLPADLQAAIKPVVKYTDNVANGTGSIAANVTPTTDYVFLLAPYEMLGASISYVNEYELSYQEQYAFYRDIAVSASNRIRYRRGTTTPAVWKLRSPRQNANQYFCAVTTSGTATVQYGRYSAGFAPCFCV